MSLFPAASTALTSANVAFLEVNLLGLQHPRSVVRGEVNAFCRHSVESTLAGKISVLEAASELTQALQHLHVERLRSGLVGKDGKHIPVVASTNVHRLKDFAGDGRWIRDFLIVHPPAGEWDVPEMTTLTGEYTNGVKQMEYRWYAGRADSPIVTENPVNKLMSFIRLGDLYSTFIQPKGTRLWRFPPIPFVVGAMTLLFGEIALTPHFTAGESSLQSYMDDGRAWRMLNIHLENAVREGEATQEFLADVTAGFRERLQAAFRGHPRRERVLGVSA